jgi:hypothetical protein
MTYLDDTIAVVVFVLRRSAINLPEVESSAIVDFATAQPNRYPLLLTRLATFVWLTFEAPRPFQAAFGFACVTGADGVAHRKPTFFSMVSFFGNEHIPPRDE